MPAGSGQPREAGRPSAGTDSRPSVPLTWAAVRPPRAGTPGGVGPAGTEYRAAAAGAGAGAGYGAGAGGGTGSGVGAGPVPGGGPAPARGTAPAGDRRRSRHLLRCRHRHRHRHRADGGRRRGDGHRGGERHAGAGGRSGGEPRRAGGLSGERPHPGPVGLAHQAVHRRRARAVAGPGGGPGHGGSPPGPVEHLFQAGHQAMYVHLGAHHETQEAAGRTDLVAALTDQDPVLGEHPVPDDGALGAHREAHEEEVPLGGIDRQAGQRGQPAGHLQAVAAHLVQALRVLRAVVAQHEHHVLREGVEVPLRQHGAHPARQRRIGDQIAEADAVQAEVLAEAAQDDDVGAQHRLPHDAGFGLRVGELQEGLVDHDEVPVGHRVHELHQRLLVQIAAVGVVGVADHHRPRPPGPDELGVPGEVEGEAGGLLEREHVDPLAGLHRLVGPAAEGGDGDGEGVADQQVVDPGDQLGGTVAHGHALGRQFQQAAQLGRDGVGAARVVGDDVAQPAGHLLEHRRGGEVRVAGDAEVHRSRARLAALPRQRRHRRAVRRGTAEQRGDVAGQVDLRRWTARAGSAGRPCIRRSRRRCSTRVKKVCPTGASGPHAPNEWTVVVRYVCPGRSTVDGKDGWFGESGKCCVSRHSASPCR